MLCVVCDCHNEALDNGKCAKHNKRKCCSVEGCLSLTRCAGKCEKHLNENTRCLIKSCDNKTKAQGFCGKHLKKYRATHFEPKSFDPTEKEKIEIRKRIEEIRATKDKDVPTPDKLPVRENVYRLSWRH